MIYTSPDAQWIAVRHGRDVRLVVGCDPSPPPPEPIVPGTLTLASDDVELAFVGAPSVLIAIAPDGIVLHQPPSLEPVATLPLDTPMRLAAITGPRFALVAADGKRVVVVRVAGRALAAQTIEHQTPIELAVGLDRNQLLFGVMRRLEVWDAVSARPLLRLQLQLPPPPRSVGAAQGHLWATRPGSDEIFLYRLSDGRPFRHQAGSPIEDVIGHPASPVLVLVTSRGLVRLHCFAHSLAMIDAPWQRGTALAQLAGGNDLLLIGDSGDEPWRVSIGASVATRPLDERVETGAPVATRPPDERVEIVAAAATTSAPLPVSSPSSSARIPPGWREPLAAIGAELARGGTVELGTCAITDDTELGELARRLALSDAARRALVVLYAIYLVGEPAISIAQLARVLGDWTEPLGQGELAALLRRRGGRISLRPSITSQLDGIAPRA